MVSNKIDAIRGIHIVTDKRAVQKAPIPRDVVTAVDLALRGGANVVQDRNKTGTTVERIAVGRQLREVTRRYGALFLANGDVQAALATEADGIHIRREDDGDPRKIRSRIGSHRVLGMSIEGEDYAEIRIAEEAGVDYIGVTVFQSETTKPEARPVGLAGVRRIRRATKLPIVVIGGITPANIEAVFDAGAHAAAVVGASLRQTDPEGATRDLVMRKNLVEARR
jgi:thiamine-phosphate pyrophosphorylase